MNNVEWSIGNGLHFRVQQRYSRADYFFAQMFVDSMHFDPRKNKLFIK